MLAGLLAGLATLTRPVGIVALVPLLVEFLAMGPSEASTRWSARSVGILCAITGPTLAAGVGYLVFAVSAFGHPLAVFGTQASVRGAIAAPWQPFVELWRARPRLHSFGNSLVDAALAAIAIATLPAIFRQLRASYACYALLILAIPLSGSLISFNRLLLPSFPHAILLARLVNSPRLFTAILVVFGIAEGMMMAAFATWHWVA
jgi:hypothetical protein